MRVISDSKLFKQSTVLLKARSADWQADVAVLLGISHPCVQENVKRLALRNGELWNRPFDS